MKHKKKPIIKLLVILTILITNILSISLPTYAFSFRTSSSHSTYSSSPRESTQSYSSSKWNSRFNTSDKYSSPNSNSGSRFKTSDKYNNQSPNNNKSNSNNSTNNNSNTNDTFNNDTSKAETPNYNRRSSFFIPSFSPFGFLHGSSFIFKAVLVLAVVVIVIFLIYYFFFN